LPLGFEPLTLTIVIPALNEQDSIGSTIQRCLDARERICRVGGVKAIDVIVVSDGSTDRTTDIAREFAVREKTVTVIAFERNRGYGAAIKEGFASATGELVAFLDADGTCDPEDFGELCRALREEQAVVALGSRMQPGSQMPRLRRIGNSIYALLLGSLSGRVVTDTASGMRVLRRDALPTLYPLPDGLHFTPAMSARAVMSDQRIVEIPIAYSERIGKSKLHMLRDGLRFLLAIRDAVLLYQPSRIFALAAFICIIVGLFWSSYPVEFYLRNRRLEEWMIYRLLLCGFLMSAAFTMLCAGVLSDRVLALVYRRSRSTLLAVLFDRLLYKRRLLYLATVSGAVALFLVWPGLTEYVRTGHVTMHWSRPLFAVFLLQIGLMAVVCSTLQKFVNLWSEQLAYTSRKQR
jgi:glycosyltransferase involved in cell wall biosynthesis